MLGSFDRARSHVMWCDAMWCDASFIECKRWRWQRYEKREYWLINFIVLRDSHQMFVDRLLIKSPSYSPQVVPWLEASSKLETETDDQRAKNTGDQFFDWNRLYDYRRIIWITRKGSLFYREKEIYKRGEKWKKTNKYETTRMNNTERRSTW